MEMCARHLEIRTGGGRDTTYLGRRWRRRETKEKSLIIFDIDNENFAFTYDIKDKDRGVEGDVGF